MNFEYSEKMKNSNKKTELKSTQRIVETQTPSGLTDEKIVSESSLHRMSRRALEELAYDLNLPIYRDLTKSDLADMIWARYE